MAEAGLLEVSALRVEFPSPASANAGAVRVLDDVAFRIAPGETLALVGESGSGKSMTSLAIMRLLAPGGIASGSIRLQERQTSPFEIVGASEAAMRAVRGKRIGMVFQDPMSSLNPLFTVGAQIAEAVRLHHGVSRGEARRHAVEMLRRVGIPAPSTRLGAYPHQLSGGMRQRVAIAMALACRPALLIADEPTTALDVTIQAQIIDLLCDLQQETGMAILFITHDLALVSSIASRVAVMYAGRIVEIGAVGDVFSQPRHPYTRALLQCLPTSGEIVRDARGRTRLLTIPGQVHPMAQRPAGCGFAERCGLARPECRQTVLTLHPVGADAHLARCLRSDLP